MPRGLTDPIKKYVSVDIEASGDTPGKYSMISLGACMVDDESKTFYRELKPISSNFNYRAMQVGCSELDCLKNPQSVEVDPRSDFFRPERALDILRVKGQEPVIVMGDFEKWILSNTVGFRPIEVAGPIKFDGMFTQYYFDNFLGRNPLSYSGEDINSMYRGVMKDPYAHIYDHDVGGNPRPHNALSDAIVQARQFQKVLSLLEK
jgi:ribonuclease T